MVLLKYFKIKKCAPPLPDPSGSLNQHLSSSAIEKANKEVTAVLGDPAKHHPYLKISIMAKYAANHGIVNAVRQFSKDFPENSLKESTIRGWKKTCLKALSLWKKASKGMTVEIRIAEACRSFRAANYESFPYIMHIVDEPRKFSPLNGLMYTVCNHNIILIAWHIC